MNEQLQRDLGRMEGKLDALLDSFKDVKEAQDVTNKAFNTRLTSVERKQWYASGGAAVIGVLIAKINWLSMFFPK